jgi:hypothetical protein
LAVVTLLLAVALGVAWHGFDSRQKAEISLAVIARQQAALVTRMHAAETKIAQGERERAEIQPVLKELPALRPVPSPLAAPTAKLLDEATILAHNPELSALYAKSFRAGLTLRYGLIYQALGFSSDQVDRLNDLMAEQNSEKMKLMAAAGSEGLNRSDPDVQALLQQLRDKYAAVRGEIIGETANRQFDRLLGAFPLMGKVNDIMSLLASSSTPLTSSQGAQLLQILGNASSLDPVTAQADPETVRWDEAFRAAQDILSVSQLAAMKVEFQLSELARLNKEFYQRQLGAK